MTTTDLFHQDQNPQQPPTGTAPPTVTRAAHPYACAEGEGIAGALVLVKAPSDRHSPQAITDKFTEALQALVDVTTGPAKDFLDALPVTVTPVAALGLAVRAQGASDASHSWYHVQTKEGASRWTYCSAHVSPLQVRIEGELSSAECAPDGRLTVDSGVPSDIADALRAAYNDARGVVDQTRILALVIAHLKKIGGRRITSDVYLVPQVDPVLGGVLDGLHGLGGWAETVAVADAEKIARLTSPVTKSIEQQIQEVVDATAGFIAKAESVAKDGGIMKSTSINHIREEIREASEAAALWRDRLSLASLDVDAKLNDLIAAAERADKEAQDRMEADREARKKDRTKKGE